MFKRSVATLGSALHVLALHSLKPNLKPGKTSFLCKFRGPGAKSSGELFGGPPDFPTVSFSVNGVHHMVYVVFSYVHVVCVCE